MQTQTPSLIQSQLQFSIDKMPTKWSETYITTLILPIAITIIHNLTKKKRHYLFRITKPPHMHTVRARRTTYELTDDSLHNSRVLSKDIY